MNQKEICKDLFKQCDQLRYDIYLQSPKTQTIILDSHKTYYEVFKNIIFSKFNLETYSVLYENGKIDLTNLENRCILSIILETNTSNPSPKKYYKGLKVKTYSSSYNKGNEAILIGKVVELILKKERICINKINKAYYTSTMQFKKDLNAVRPLMKTLNKKLLKALNILTKITLKHIKSSPIIFTEYSKEFMFYERSCYNLSTIEFNNIKNNTSNILITANFSKENNSPQGTWELQNSNLELFVKEYLIYDDLGQKITQYSNVFT